MLAASLFVAGLVLTTVAVAALAGAWWGVLLAGLLLVAGGVLTERGSTPAPKGGDDQ